MLQHETEGSEMMQAGQDHKRRPIKPVKKRLALGLAVLMGVLAVGVSMTQGKEKVYWHVVIKALMIPNGAEEWAWVTFVEMDKAEAFPEIADLVEKSGGEFEGTNLAQVRAAAWRSSYSYAKDRKCNGRPSKIEISWTESWSDSVLARCLIIPKMHPDVVMSFRFGFCATNAKVLMEGGQRRGLGDLVNMIVGPIDVGRGEREEMRGKFATRAINYEDALTHYKFCGKSWVEQYDSMLLHYTHDSLYGSFDATPDSAEGMAAFGFNGLDITAFLFIIRNSSRDHPYWKQKYLGR